jgi:hypothetical protein
MRVTLYGIIAVVVSCNLGAVAGCEDTTPALPCVDAPPTGCPDDFGADVCQDPACSAVYSCDNGKWTFVRACGPADGSVDASVAREAGAPEDALASDRGEIEIDAPVGAFGGAGCVSLEPPDCPLGVALYCKSSDCCGCEDLFVCADGGWNPWGACVDGAVVGQ